jgi:translocation and assembly module TamA
MRGYKRTLLAVTALCFGPAAFAADPVAYTVKFTPSGDKVLDGLLHQTASLVALQKKLPPAPFALIGRARADQQQFLVVLHSLGYDAGSVDITIDGQALDDPTLVDMLTQAPAHQVVTVQVVPHQGQVFLLGKVDITGLPPGFKAPMTLKSGQVALAGPVLGAGPVLQTALHNAGYAFAKVSDPLAVAEPAAHRLDVTFTVTPGPRVNIGPIAFSGLTRTNADFLRRHIALKPGQRYSDTGLATARDALLGLGVFSAVTPLPQDHVLPGGQVPILFRVTPQKRHAVTLSGSYATDVGFTLATSWEDRDVFTHAETLTFTAAANGLGGTGTTAPGYDLKGVFVKPDLWSRGQALTVSLEGQKESLTAYDRTALLAGAQLSRPLTPHVSFSYGPSFEDEEVTQEGSNRHYTLVQFPVTLAYDTADSALEPTRGVNASITLTPTEPVIGDPSPFLIAQAVAATYIPVERDARGIIALRGQVGSIQGTTQFDVPPDQRFYAGGSGTVRGYTYQTIGPLFPDDIPEGGLAMDAVNLEFRQHVGKSFGVVPFVDAGQVNSGSAPFQGKLRVGVGMGLRYYTGIGPIRLDVAFPMTRVAGSGAFALYIGLGEAF